MIKNCSSFKNRITFNIGPLKTKICKIHKIGCDSYYCDDYVKKIARRKKQGVLKIIKKGESRGIK